LVESGGGGVSWDWEGSEREVYLGWRAAIVEERIVEKGNGRGRLRSERVG